MTRAQCIVHQGGKILMVKNHLNGETWWCLPGGGVEAVESAAQAALRELREECCVEGVILRETSRWNDSNQNETITFLVDIGDQTPTLGNDPEVAAGVQEHVICAVQWLYLPEIPERDRAFLWAAGLLGIAGFWEEVSDWGNHTSYPTCSDPF